MISEITCKAPVIKESLFERAKPEKIALFVQHLLRDTVAPNFENESAYNRFFKAVADLGDETVLVTTLEFMKRFRSIPDDPSTVAHQVQFYSGATCVFSCPKVLLADSEYFKTMFSSSFQESASKEGMHRINSALTIEALQTLKKLLY